MSVLSFYNQVYHLKPMKKLLVNKYIDNSEKKLINDIFVAELIPPYF